MKNTPRRRALTFEPKRNWRNWRKQEAFFLWISRLLKIMECGYSQQHWKGMWLFPLVAFSILNYLILKQFLLVLLALCAWFVRDLRVVYVWSVFGLCMRGPVCGRCCLSVVCGFVCHLFQENLVGNSSILNSHWTFAQNWTQFHFSNGFASQEIRLIGSPQSLLQLYLYFVGVFLWPIPPGFSCDQYRKRVNFSSFDAVNRSVIQVRKKRKILLT